jgi:signal transduction histidine kinase
MIVGKQNPFPQRQAPWRRWRGALVLGMLLTLLAQPAGAGERSPLILSGPVDIGTLSAHFDAHLDNDWERAPGDFVDAIPPDMHPVVGAVPDFGYTSARIWLRVRIVNQTADINDWRFYAQVNFTQAISIYLVAADGAVTTLLDLTTESPFSARPIAYPQIVAPFRLAPGEAATLLVAYYSQGSSRISMSIETPDSFSDKARLSEAKNYAFYGMMLVMVVMASVALLVLRQPVFAAYAAYLGSIFLYVAHADGVAFQYLWPNFPQFNSMASVVVGSAVMVFGGLFATSFLQTRRFNPIMHRVILVVITLVVLIDAALWIPAPQLLKQFLVVMISVCTLTFITAGVLAARTRFREVRFYLFAWLASLIPAILFTARFAFGFESPLITLYDTVRVALVFDALMMGLAVFDGYNQQRLAALEGTLAQMQRNLALSQRLAALDERYEYVTALARKREESVKDTVHDLRQPMHALRLSLRQMLDPQDTTVSDIGQFESALGYMEKLVAERLAEDAEPVSQDTATGPSLHDVLRGAADMFASEAVAKGLALRLVLAAPDRQIAAYPLMRVVANLVSNAIKYTREGRVVIALRRDGAGHRLEVHDTGPGLSGADFEQALARNARLDRDRPVAEGTGLGLSVVKEIVDANNWQISSCPERNSGASIRLRLPAVLDGHVGKR